MMVKLTKEEKERVGEHVVKKYVFIVGRIK
jgi:hypothetical protein